MFTIGKLSIKVGFVAQVLNSIAGNLSAAMLVVLLSLVVADAICKFAPVSTKTFFGGRC